MPNITIQSMGPFTALVGLCKFRYATFSHKPTNTVKGPLLRRYALGKK